MLESERPLISIPSRRSVLSQMTTRIHLTRVRAGDRTPRSPAYRHEVSLRFR
jgi:hypothetical protein